MVRRCYSPTRSFSRVPAVRNHVVRLVASEDRPAIFTRRFETFSPLCLHHCSSDDWSLHTPRPQLRRLVLLDICYSERYSLLPIKLRTFSASGSNWQRAHDAHEHPRLLTSMRLPAPSHYFYPQLRRLWINYAMSSFHASSRYVAHIARSAALITAAL